MLGKQKFHMQDNNITSIAGIIILLCSQIPSTKGLIIHTKINYEKVIIDKIVI